LNVALNTITPNLVHDENRLTNNKSCQVKKVAVRWTYGLD